MAEGRRDSASTQVGLRAGYRLEDAVLAIDYVIDKSMSTKQPLCIAFIDLEKAFDRVPRD